MKRTACQQAFLVLGLLAVLALGLGAMAQRTGQLSRQGHVDAALAQEEAGARGLAQALSSRLALYRHTVEILTADSRVAQLLAEPGNRALRDEICAVLGRHRDRLPDVLGLGLADTGGLMLAHSDRNEAGRRSLREHLAFYQALDGSTIVSRGFLSPQDGQVSLLVAAPVRVREQVRGVVCLSVSVEDLSARLLPLRGAGRMAFLVEAPHTFLVHPDPSLVLGSTSRVDWLRSMLRQKEGSFVYRQGGREFLTGFAPVPDTSWTVAVGTDSRRVLRASAQSALVSQILFFSLFLLVALVGLGGLFFLEEGREVPRHWAQIWMRLEDKMAAGVARLRGKRQRLAG